MNKDEQVNQRAYQIWEDEGRPEGQHDAHWRRAYEDVYGHGPAADGDGSDVSMQGRSPPPSPGEIFTPSEIEHAPIAAPGQKSIS